jgi:hypothetical protein
LQELVQGADIRFPSGREIGEHRLGRGELRQGEQVFADCRGESAAFRLRKGSPLPEEPFTKLFFPAENVHIFPSDSSSPVR